MGLYASMAMMNVHFTAGRYLESASWARNAIEKSPGYLSGHITLIAALALEGDLTAAAEARDTLLRLHPEFSVTRINENQPLTGEVADRIREGLRGPGCSWRDDRDLPVCRGTGRRPAAHSPKPFTPRRARAPLGSGLVRTRARP